MRIHKNLFLTRIVLLLWSGTLLHLFSAEGNDNDFVSSYTSTANEQVHLEPNQTTHNYDDGIQHVLNASFAETARLSLPSDYTLIHVDSIRHTVRRRRNVASYAAHSQPTSGSWEHFFQLPIGPSRSFVSVIAEPNYALFSSNATLTITTAGGGRSNRTSTTQSTTIPLHMQREYLVGTITGTEGATTSHIRVRRETQTGMISGHAVVNNSLFMFEPAITYGLTPDHIMVYQDTDVRWDSAGSGHCGSVYVKDNTTSASNEPFLGRSRRTGPSEGSSACGIKVVADSRFFAFNGNNRAATVQAMLGAVDFADARFANTRGLGVDDVGIVIDDVTVFEDATTDPFFKASATGWDQHDLLERLSVPDATAPLNHDRFCLVHLFTTYSLPENTQGLAFVGNRGGSAGICSFFGVSDEPKYFNTGYTTSISNGAPIPPLMRSLVTMHEFGHNFGAGHDAEDDGEVCAPGDNDPEGKFVMWPISVSGSKPNNDRFSACSVGEINAIIADKGSCFKPRPQSFCGNGVVESGGLDGDAATTADNEECDAGTISGDSCCTSDCKLTNVCSDTNSDCCQDCVVAPASKVCYGEFEGDVECKATTLCDGVSTTCPLPLNQKPEGAPCGSLGTCIPASDATQRCRSWCEQFGAVQCACAVISDSCSICCENDNAVDPYCPAGTSAIDSRTCRSQGGGETTGRRPFGSSGCKTPPEEIFDAAQYVSATGQPFAREDIFLSTNTPCPNGLCNGKGQCDLSTDDLAGNIFGSLRSLSYENIVEWMRSNVVGAVIVFTGIPWALLSAMMCWKDHRQHRQLQEQYASSYALHHRSNTCITRD
eukprot:m.535432 g.535432  ORF g.535432 m.535432 type:complete len:826 (+) comp22066_c0_seq1:408-2885(+)